MISCLKMSESELKVAINRGVALITLLLCILVVGFDRWIWSDYYGTSPSLPFGVFIFKGLPWLLLIGALAYLTLSGFGAVVGTIGGDAD